MAMSSSIRRRGGLTDERMSGSVVGTSDLPLELKGDPSCSEPDPDSLNLSSPPMNAPDLAPSTPPAERVRAWARNSSDGPEGEWRVWSDRRRKADVYCRKFGIHSRPEEVAQALARPPG